MNNYTSSLKLKNTVNAKSKKITRLLSIIEQKKKKKESVLFNNE